MVTNPVDTGGEGAEALELTTEVEEIVESGLLVTVLDRTDEDAAAPGTHCENQSLR